MELLRVWLKDFNLFILILLKAFFSKNWTLFFLNFLWFDSENWTSFEIKTWLKELNLFSIRLTELRIVFFQFDSKNWIWLKGFNFSHMTQRIGPILNMTHRIEHFFSMWLKELNMIQSIEPLFQYDSKNWTLFFIWLKELNPSLNMTHRNFSEL